MHRDTKLGLALGILLIGVVGALFFRNDADSRVDVPQLDDPQTLDEQISEQPLAPYLTGIETEASETEDESQTASDGTGTNRPGANPSVTRSFHLENQRAAIPDPISPRDEDRSPPDEPPQNSPFNEISVSQPETARTHNEDWSVFTEEPTERPAVAAGESSSSGPEGRPGEADDSSTAQAPNPPAGPPSSSADDSRTKSSRIRLYRVRKGETLSELASRFLGSSGKYREIFELNRDVLEDPDDVRAGMTIRIPLNPDAADEAHGGPIGEGGHRRASDGALLRRGGPRGDARIGRPVSANKPKPTTDETAEAKTEQTDRLGQDPLQRFVPVRRFPFVPRRNPVVPSQRSGR